MQLITAATFHSERAAQSVKERLEGAGIEAHLHDERKLQRFWFLSRPYAGVRLKVKTEDLERAIELLEKWDAADGVLQEAVRCPECGSSRIEYPQMTRHFFLPTLFCHLLSLFGVLPAQFYCQKCQYTWRRRRAKRQNSVDADFRARPAQR